MTELDKNIARNALKIALAEKGWNKNELCGKANISVTTINNILNGTRGLGPRLRRKLSKALNIPESTLINVEKNSTSEKNHALPREEIICPPDASTIIIGKAGIVLQSGTIYGNALRQNIEAFYQAVLKDSPENEKTMLGILPDDP